ncbi:MAG: ribonuclease catalytic domain-containing protein [Desulfobacteraceae bacterium]|jgi:exoribonuclease-2
MEPGHVVEFIDSQKIYCAVVTDIKKLRLRLLTENNREVKMAAGRLTHQSALLLDTSATRLKLVDELKAIAARRRLLSEQIDIQDLWEVLNSEQEWIDLATMTALCFPQDPTGDHESAVIRALFNDRLYFKFDIRRFFPYSAQKVEQIQRQRKAAEQQERLIAGGSTWMQKVLAGQNAQAPEQKNTICDILASYYLFEKESPHREMARSILKRTGTGSPGAIFTFLTKVGRWHPDQNLELLRYGISTEFSVEVETHADTLCRNSTVVLNGRRDLRDLPVVTIDGPSTVDFDDAVSIVREGDKIVIGIHITDVGYYIAKEDPIDQVARQRCSSIYMPDGKISMLPAKLSDDACSLIAGQERPAISTLIHLDLQADIHHYEIVPSLIRVGRQLTFHDVDEMVQDDPAMKELLIIAQNYRKHRLRNGALIIDLPELNIRTISEGEPVVSLVDRESPGRMLVSELMIMANELAARYLTDKRLPAIFRSQAEPRERLFENNTGTLFQNWMQRKLINRFVLNSSPERHAGLGLPSYVTATSPIRKYFDLVTQRQLRAASGLEKPYTEEQIEAIITATTEPMSHVGRVQFRRQRYWLLKHLQTRTGQKEEAQVLYKRRAGYMILLQKYLLECPLSGADGVKLRPEDLIQVTIQHVNARNDVITVVLG